ncbi:hypothetical protein DV451_001608 [Geotrichum candidum]|uniref:Protein farnesyltransferase/geranylgeranyltransferase type-1 subunit alpha n=1 Tax=Geotrichum candidum TaxID=1173061 RepID=A0A9P5G8L2_GEOCN|nr:hypothetical protein DV451_001608 [Geotrichum candidum]
MASDPSDYTDFNWEDIIPVPQDDGVNPLVQIMYSDDYKQATSLLRAVMAKHEYSPRALALTEDIIETNSAHYTVWHYRLEILKHLKITAVPKENWLPSAFKQNVNHEFAIDGAFDSLDDEILEDYIWLNETTEATAKNYQIWHYRQLLKPSPKANPLFRKLYFAMERFVVELVLSNDAKNYHAWSHLQWLAKNTPPEFRLQLDEEIEYTTFLLSQDVYNNSAWAYRYFILPEAASPELLEREIGYVHFAITEVPQNEASWNYLVGLYERFYFSQADKSTDALAALEEFCLRFAPIDQPGLTEEVVFRSTHALETLVTIYEKQKKVDKARKVLGLLETYIPIRKGYWAYKIKQLEAVN